MLQDPWDAIGMMQGRYYYFFVFFGFSCRLKATLNLIDCVASQGHPKMNIRYFCLHPSGGCANTQHPNRIPLAFSWLPGVDLVANGWAIFLLDFVFSVSVFGGPLGMRMPIGMLHPKAPGQHPDAWMPLG